MPRRHGPHPGDGQNGPRGLSWGYRWRSSRRVETAGFRQSGWQDLPTPSPPYSVFLVISSDRSPRPGGSPNIAELQRVPEERK
jgi:hypothetical protein